MIFWWLLSSSLHSVSQSMKDFTKIFPMFRPKYLFSIKDYVVLESCACRKSGPQNIVQWISWAAHNHCVTSAMTIFWVQQ